MPGQGYVRLWLSFLCHMFSSWSRSLSTRKRVRSKIREYRVVRRTLLTSTISLVSHFGKGLTSDSRVVLRSAERLMCPRSTCPAFTTSTGPR